MSNHQSDPQRGYDSFQNRINQRREELKEETARHIAVARVMLKFGVPCRFELKDEFAVLSKPLSAEKLAFILERKGSVRLAYDYNTKSDTALTDNDGNLIIFPSMGDMYDTIKAVHIMLHPDLEVIEYIVQVMQHLTLIPPDFVRIIDGFSYNTGATSNGTSIVHVPYRPINILRVREICAQFHAKASPKYHPNILRLEGDTNGTYPAHWKMVPDNVEILIWPSLPIFYQLPQDLFDAQIEGIVNQMQMRGGDFYVAPAF